MALKPDSEDPRARQLAQRHAAEQDALLREVDEAVRQDEVGTLVKRHGWKIGGALVLALALFGGWLFWSDRQEGQLEETSEQFVTALDQLDAGQIRPAQGNSESCGKATVILLSLLGGAAWGVSEVVSRLA